MEVAQWNFFLCSYFKQTKVPFFKNGEREGKTGPVWELAAVGGGRWGAVGWMWWKYYVVSMIMKKWDLLKLPRMGLEGR
jgi:hypothetical protein